MTPRLRQLVLIGFVLIATACSDVEIQAVPASDSVGPSVPPSSVQTTIETSVATTAATTTSLTTSSTVSESTSVEETSTSVEDQPTRIRIRLERRVADDATAEFAELVEAVLRDERGWQRAGFEFAFSDTDYDYTVVLAEGSEVDQLCLPYDTGGRFSCQIGSVVALNADRWRTAVDSWPATLDEYRTMLVNHEVGHLIGQHHPAVRCPGEGEPAPVMAQQSSGVAPCTANPWPQDWEIDCAMRRLEPLAPPYETDIQLTCGPDGPLG